MLLTIGAGIKKPAFGNWNEKKTRIELNDLIDNNTINKKVVVNDEKGNIIGSITKKTDGIYFEKPNNGDFFSFKVEKLSKFPDKNNKNINKKGYKIFLSDLYKNMQKNPEYLIRKDFRKFFRINLGKKDELQEITFKNQNGKIIGIIQEKSENIITLKNASNGKEYDINHNVTLNGTPIKSKPTVQKELNEFLKNLYPGVKKQLSKYLK